jgi:class 3 adenylate cyclase
VTDFLPTSEGDALLVGLRQSADPAVAAAIAALIRDAPDHELCRVNVPAFAARSALAEEPAIAGFLYAARLGLFELSWNVLCPSCGGVLAASETLKSVDREEYHCAWCAAGYAPILDEVVEVTFTVNPRVRRIAAHDPDTLPFAEYLRQIFWSSAIDLPPDLDRVIEDIILDTVELPPGGKALLSLHLPAEFVIVLDPVTHRTQFLDVKGEPTRERRTLAMIFDRLQRPTETLELRPGPLRLTLENRTDARILPGVWMAGEALHQLLGRRRPFLSAKRLLTNQVFRDLYGTEVIAAEQRLKITSLTFLFTDLKGSTELYERVGDIAAFDLVRAHFALLQEIIAGEAGAIVKTIGDAVMATFPTPDRALAAALRMREAMRRLNDERGRDDLALKIGIHEGPCLAVVLNDRQDYFGQTVNIAARVQGLADSHGILTTGRVVAHPQAARLIESAGLEPVSRRRALRGIADEFAICEIP